MVAHQPTRVQAQLDGFAQWRESQLAQLGSAVDPVWREVPPDMLTFVTGAQYLNKRIADTPGVIGIRPAILDMVIEIDETNAKEIYIEAGRGSGKSYVSAVLTLREVNKMMSLRDPYTYFGLDKAHTFYLVNASINAKQAKEVVFDKIGIMLEQSPYFNPPGGTPKYILYEDHIEFPGYPVEILSGHSEGWAWKGYEFITGVIDEANFFKNTQNMGGRDWAEEIYKAIKYSQDTRYLHPDRHGKLVVISSVGYEGDFMDRVMKVARREMMEAQLVGRKPTMLAFSITTWDAFGISMDQFTGGFDAEGLSRNQHRPYREVMQEAGNIRPLVTDAFFKFTEPLARMKRTELVPILKGYEYISRVPLQDGTTREYVATRLAQPMHFKPDVNYYIAGDASVINDRFVIMLGHAERSYPTQFKLDATLTWTPQPSSQTPRPVDYANVTQCLVDITNEARRQGANIVYAAFDGFNSPPLLRILEGMGIPTLIDAFGQGRQLTIYQQLEILITAGYLQIPADENADMLIYELSRLQLLNGKKVDHPYGGSKDMADALALLMAIIAQFTPHLQAPLVPNLFLDGDNRELTEMQQVPYLPPNAPLTDPRDLSVEERMRRLGRPMPDEVPPTSLEDGAVYYEGSAAAYVPRQGARRNVMVPTQGRLKGKR